jgi:hypothetical protein
VDAGAANSSADRQLAELARDYLDDHAQRHPESATEAGDHRFDAQLGDQSAAALARERQALDRYAARPPISPRPAARARGPCTTSCWPTAPRPPGCCAPGCCPDAGDAARRPRPGPAPGRRGVVIGAP